MAKARPELRHDAGAEGKKKQSTGEQAGHFFGGVHAHHDRQTGETILQNRDCGDPEEGADDGALAAKDTRAAEDDGGDGKEFVAGAGVGFGLAEAGGVNDGGDGGDQAGEHVGKGEAAGDR